MQKTQIPYNSAWVFWRIQEKWELTGKWCLKIAKQQTFFCRRLLLNIEKEQGVCGHRKEKMYFYIHSKNVH